MVGAGLLLVHLDVPGKGRRPISLLNMLCCCHSGDRYAPRFTVFSVIYNQCLGPAITHKGHRYISPSLRGKQDITAKGLSDGSIRHPLSFTLCLSVRLTHKPTFVLEMRTHSVPILMQPGRETDKRFNFLKYSRRSISSRAKLKAMGKCGPFGQFNVFIALSGNLKEMRGKEPLADWTYLVKPLGVSTGCFRQRKMTPDLVYSSWFGDIESSSQADVPNSAPLSPHCHPISWHTNCCLLPAQTLADLIVSYRNTSCCFLFCIQYKQSRECVHHTPCHQFCRWHGPSFQS